ncbi:phytanoyl-CoA dioxygenase [Methylomonas sp. LW13]|uniref:phytanoyl-CoA dioxygenase family protein n=1 Tax=unclassified Methylomonas TaxID=2608980 RepID=UPI00051AECC9|nr:phytanoyl-CoA dioxygenase family protein [Methylomonas sp. LW13]QBC28221.1 phytanoyl-CoA dioxygenase [Methylomonas sp. LW13]
MTVNSIPSGSYGVWQQCQVESVIDEVVEQVTRVGYAVVDGGYSLSELKDISDEFNRIRKRYISMYGEQLLRDINEYHTIRSPLTHNGGVGVFIGLALNENLLLVLRRLISGKFVLNQQNGVINPPLETYNQGAWHRDLPYQHFVSTKPLAINALFCVDDFTFENGATFVLPASHLSEPFPSLSYIQRNAIQVEAKAGSFIVLDCMLFHSGGFNKTNYERRAVNHLYNIPFFKQQISIPNNINDNTLSQEAKEILGYDYMEASSVGQYFAMRKNKYY